MGCGYDHNWCIKDEPAVSGLKKAAYAASGRSGLTLTCYTTLPGVQFYTGNFLKGGIPGKHGVEFQCRTGFCLETQYYPNAPAKPGFPQPSLKKGETWRAQTVYVLRPED